MEQPGGPWRSIHMMATCSAASAYSEVGPIARQARLRMDTEAAFRAVLADSLARLELCDLNLVTFHHLRGLSVDQLAELACRPPASVLRQLGRIRERLLRDLRRGLAARLPLDKPALDRLLAVVRSELDLAIGSVLRAGAPRVSAASR